MQNQSGVRLPLCAAVDEGWNHPGNSAPNPGEVVVWDVNSGEEIWSFPSLPDCVFNVAFSPDGKRLIAGAGKSNERPRQKRPVQLKLWNMETGMEMLSLTGPTASVYKAVFTPDGTRIMAVSIDGLLVYDSRPAGKEVFNLDSPIEGEVAEGE